MTTRHRTKGWSLAKGPVGVIGLVLLAYGITALVFGGHGFAQHAPTGAGEFSTPNGGRVGCSDPYKSDSPSVPRHNAYVWVDGLGLDVSPVQRDIP